MAKGSFTTNERAIWNSIYGASRGPSSGRLKILVEEFTRLGLTPAMTRVDDEMLPYDADVFDNEIASAMGLKEDDRVQVYYHPAECEKVVGSTATTWVQWGRLILEVAGLVPRGVDEHPCLKENVPRVQLPVEVRDALQDRGVTTASVCRLVSARVVAFFIAAQYEAWATPSEVNQVVPFKESLRKLGFTVRDCDVRRDKGIDEIIAGLDKGRPAVRQPFNAPVAAPEVPGIDKVEAAVGGACRAATSLILSAVRDEDIEDEIAATELRLSVLRQRLEAARVSNIRKEFLAATVSDVRLDERGGLLSIMLTFPNGSFATYTIDVSDDSSDADEALNIHV